MKTTTKNINTKKNDAKREALNTNLMDIKIREENYQRERDMLLKEIKDTTKGKAIVIENYSC